MKEQEIQKILREQKQYFLSGKTLPVKSRIFALQKLKQILQSHEEEIYQALYEDLGKSQAESYMCELGMVYSELNYMLKHIKKFAKKKTVSTPLAQAVSHSYVKPSPKGTVLVMSPWNYPFMLTLEPAIDAIAAGNTVIMKPSAYAPSTGKLIGTIVAEAFPTGLAAVIQGGREENQQLLHQPFDHIFFTGSQAVGKEVMRCAAENLTPVTLELGGKSPCIVEKTADISVAARRIVFGKYLNCGQTCVAPDYICCDREIEPQLKAAIVKEIKRQFTGEPLRNPAYGKIINQKHYDRLTALLNQSEIFYGGRSDLEKLKIEPTVISPCDWEDKVMEEELFGPILPIIPYDDIEDVLCRIQARPHPLALYLFSKDKKLIERVMAECSFGGGCVNDTIIHLATSNMGFGGVGSSGMGAYHGKVGFDTFSHDKSIVDKKTWLDLPMRYQPYTKLYQKAVKLFLK